MKEDERTGAGKWAWIVAVAGVGALVALAGRSPAVPGGLPWAAATPTPTPTPRLYAVYETRRFAEFHVDPEEAWVTVNGKVIGRADDWDDAGGGRQYPFAGEGWYSVKLAHPKDRTRWVKVVVDHGAGKEIAKVKFDLEKRR